MPTVKSASQPISGDAAKASRIGAVFDRLGQGLSAGELKDLTSCWALPALVLSDQGAVSVTSRDQVEKFLQEAIKAYRAQGLVSTRPQLERVESLSDQLAAVEVRWPTFDNTGTERASERSYYIMQFGPDGQPRIRVTLNRAGDG